MEYLDEIEKKYFEVFGMPVLVGHDAIVKPHVDVYVFYSEENNDYLYITKGMDMVGLAEMVILTKKQEKWPVFFLQNICGYALTSNTKIREADVYTSSGEIREANGFRSALFLGINLIGFKRKKIRLDLGLNRAPLFVLPITQQEFEYERERGVESLVNLLMGRISPFMGVDRESTV